MNKDIILHIISFLPYKDIVRYKTLSKGINKGIQSFTFQKNFERCRDTAIFTIDVMLKGDDNPIYFPIQGNEEDIYASCYEIRFHHHRKIETLNFHKGWKKEFCSYYVSTPYNSLNFMYFFDNEIYSFKHDLIDWFKYEEFQEDDLEIQVYKTRPSFCDETDEIEYDKIPFDQFLNVEWHETLRNVKTVVEDDFDIKTGKFHTTFLSHKSVTETIIRWESKGLRFMFQDVEEGYIAIFENIIDRTFIVISCLGSHPCIQCPAFSFYNSDGSTSPFEIKDYDPTHLIQQLKEIAKEYICEPCH